MNENISPLNVLKCLAIYVENVIPEILRRDIQMEDFDDDYFYGHWKSFKTSFNMFFSGLDDERRILFTEAVMKYKDRIH